MLVHLSYCCIGVGLVFWFWGTWPLLGDRSVLFKLHSLSVADTLGSMSIIIGLLLRIPREWPLLVLALISLAIWNTVLGYVLAYCSTRQIGWVERQSEPQAAGASVGDMSLTSDGRLLGPSQTDAGNDSNGGTDV